jgi:hypothetical protein
MLPLAASAAPLGCGPMRPAGSRGACGAAGGEPGWRWGGGETGPRDACRVYCDVGGAPAASFGVGDAAGSAGRGAPCSMIMLLEASALESEGGLPAGRPASPLVRAALAR